MNEIKKEASYVNKMGELDGTREIVESRKYKEMDHFQEDYMHGLVERIKLVVLESSF